ncbi:MAG: ATP-dependent DNA helicase RecG, partial [Flavobacteriaceae bacterium]
MRPAILNPLFEPVTGMKGIAAANGRLIATALGVQGRDARFADLLWHIPHSIVDRRYRPDIAHAEPSRIATILLTVDRHRPQPRAAPRAPYRVECHDESGEMTLVFFNARREYLERTLPVGARRLVSGRVDIFNGLKQIVHPDFIVDEADAGELPEIEPVYGLTAGLSPKTMARVVREAVARVPALPEWIDPAVAARENFPAFAEAVTAINIPADETALLPQGRNRRRIAYDEILAGQLALHLVRGRMAAKPGVARTGPGDLGRMVREALPYRLTGAQERALGEICDDLAAASRMLRLLQGDVGAGKTVVALLAAAQVIESGAQVAFMAPTEILARQHFATLQGLAGAASISIAVLTGREKGAERKETLRRLESGEIDILVGTHALFQSGVEFADLGLAIVDEQHRFGVHQRLAIADKGEAVDFLVMTATPIPRTLQLTLYGDMAVSALDEKPPGRTPVDTRAMPLERIDDVVSRLGAAIGKGARVYWICPLVEDSEGLEATAAEERFKALEAHFPGRVGLVHGRLKGRDKDAVMARFSAGEIDILVATTVVEVGVDVPEATLMVIENAERFGL